MSETPPREKLYTRPDGPRRWKSKDLEHSAELACLRGRPEQVHVALTGRRCPPELIGMADTVAEMQPVKHAFAAGIPAQAGIEH